MVLRPWRRAQSSVCSSSADAAAEILQTFPAACPWALISTKRSIQLT